MTVSARAAGVRHSTSANASKMRSVFLMFSSSSLLRISIHDRGRASASALLPRTMAIIAIRRRQVNASGRWTPLRFRYFPDHAGTLPGPVLGEIPFPSSRDGSPPERSVRRPPALFSPLRARGQRALKCGAVTPAAVWRRPASPAASGGCGIACQRSASCRHPPPVKRGAAPVSAGNSAAFSVSFLQLCHELQAKFTPAKAGKFQGQADFRELLQGLGHEAIGNVRPVGTHIEPQRHPAAACQLPHIGPARQ